ncbi:MAG: hypothetical protein H6695_07985 [Deferribacteres bacterium]|nr:hypothetical protein [candidate division KSB1 bacterium]MCB9510106.1 hypothetical protein [Deferribacteres bacterium]
MKKSHPKAQGNPDEIVAVAHFDNELSAEIALTILEAQRIEASLVRDDPAGMGLHRGARIMVFVRDAEKARTVLQAEHD